MLARNSLFLAAVLLLLCTARLPGAAPQIPGTAELRIDDGESERGVAGDGMYVLNRLTPPSYPARLRSVRVFWEAWLGAPDPVGRTVRMVVLTGSPEQLRIAVDQRVKITATNQWLDHAVDAPLLTAGEFWVGFQVTSDLYVGLDTHSPRQQTWSSFDGVSASVLKLRDGSTGNAMIRALVATKSDELAIDDGSAEWGVTADGYLLVNRLTPVSWPVKLTAIRARLPHLRDEASPVGKSIRVVAFTDPGGSGRPPANPKLLVDQRMNVPKAGEFVDFAVDGPVVESGDLYVGYEVPKPRDGLAFSGDSDGLPASRTFASDDGGRSWSGPITLSDQTAVNLLIRAVVTDAKTSAGDPADVVRLALEAQGRGDVEGMLALYAIDEFGGEARERGAAIARAVGRAASWTNPALRVRSTGRSDSGNWTVVRAEFSADAVVNGQAERIEEGVLAHLVRRDGSWKLLWIVPDDLLNMEIEERAGRMKDAAPAAARRSAGTVESLSQRVDELLSRDWMNEEKLKQDFLFGTAAARIPVVGPVTAGVYEVIDSCSTGKEAFQDFRNWGLTQVGLAKIAQVGVGGVQFFLEAVPGADWIPDLFQMALDKWTVNQEIRRGLYKLRYQLMSLDSGQIRVNPQLFVWDTLPGQGFDAPKGMQTVGVLPGDAVHSYGKPLQQINFTDPAAIGATVYFSVVGEVPVNFGSSTALIADKLGGQVRGEQYWVPVFVPFLVESDASRGDGVLEGYSLFRWNSLSVARWTVTCRRGHQTLMLKLRTGETTLPIRVANTFMNQVNGLRVSGGGKVWDAVELEVGASMDGLRVTGTSSHAPEALWPDLTRTPQCLDMAIPGAGVARLARGGETVRIDGVAKGETEWKLLLGGSGTGEPGEIARSIPVRVTQKDPPSDQLRFLQQTTRVTLNVKGSREVSTGTTIANSYMLWPDWVPEAPRMALQWSGTTFTASNDGPRYRYEARGVVSNDLKTLLEFRVTEFDKAYSTTLEMQVRNLPAPANSISGTYFVATGANAAASLVSATTRSGVTGLGATMVAPTEITVQIGKN